MSARSLPKNGADTAANPAEAYLNSVASLPPAPTLVTELLALFREPDHDVDRVVQLITYEPSLTAQILRTCNSVHFAGSEPPSDIFEAVSRIGFYQVYCLVVSIFGAKTKSMQGVEQGVNVDELWRHSVAVAVASSVVAGDGNQTKAIAFTAGLLHDIGKLVLASAEREPYARLIQKAKDDNVTLSSLERSVLGVDHAELGGELMRRWNLPSDVVSAVAQHHHFSPPLQCPHLTATAQLGDVIAHQLFSEDLAKTDILSFSTSILDTLKLTIDDLPALLDKTEAEMEKVKGVLNI